MCWWRFFLGKLTRTCLGYLRVKLQSTFRYRTRWWGCRSLTPCFRAWRYFRMWLCKLIAAYTFLGTGLTCMWVCCLESSLTTLHWHPVWILNLISGNQLRIFMVQTLVFITSLTLRCCYRTFWVQYSNSESSESMWYISPLKTHLTFSQWLFQGQAISRFHQSQKSTIVSDSFPKTLSPLQESTTTVLVSPSLLVNSSPSGQSNKMPTIAYSWKPKFTKRPSPHFSAKSSITSPHKLSSFKFCNNIRPSTSWWMSKAFKST